MPGAEQPDRRGVVELAYAVETHAVQAPQREALAVVECQRDIDRFYQPQLHERRDERLRLLEPGLDLPQGLLHRPQGIARLPRLVEQRLAFIRAESHVLTVDGDALVGDEKAFTLQHQRI